ncbi:MAG: type II toxin-antitoxin system HicA family toxin [Alphaproteobacteria bacterium]|nr:type II toxin-antitoxin system HicA family toxin [Alphaproteobacteria bacterium]
MHCRDVIRALERDGWRGDDHIFRHPSKPDRVIMPHPVCDIPIDTLRSIER